MKSRNIYSGVLSISIIFLFLISEIAFSQNYNDALRLSKPYLGIGAKANSMGGAFLGVSDDYSAVYWNPAGLFQITRMEFSGTFNYNKFANDATFFNNTTNYSQSQSSLNNLGFVFPFPTFRGSLVFAMGYNKIINFNDALSFDAFNSGNTSMIQNLLGKGDISYILYLTDSTGNKTPINGNLNQSGKNLSTGFANQWSFSGAMEVAKNLSVGISLNLLSGTLKKTREYTEYNSKGFYSDTLRLDPADPRTAGFQYFMFDETLDWELGGFNLKMGFMYRYQDLFRLGLTLKFPNSYTIKEIYGVEASSKFKAGFNPALDPPIEDKIEYEISTPYEFGLGLSFSKYGLLLAGDINLIDYTEMTFSGLNGSKNNTNYREINELFKMVFNFNIGIEYQIPLIEDFALKVRGGFAMKQSPFKNDPSDFDQKYITAGLGVLFDQLFSFDFAFVYGSWKTHGDNYGAGVSRTYQSIKTTDLFFTVGYRF